MELLIGKKSTFNTHGNIGNANVFTGTVVSSIMGNYLPPEAKAVALSNHAAIYPTIPANIRKDISDDYRTYLYYQLVDDNDNFIYIGAPWIIGTSVSVITLASCTIQLTNFPDMDTQRVRMYLESAGYEIDTVKRTG